jgi:pyruvate kinase
MISRFKPSVWTVAVSHESAVCQGLAFSCGVQAVHVPGTTESWRDFARTWLRDHEVSGRTALLVVGPSPRHPDADYRIEFLRLGDIPAAPAK